MYFATDKRRIFTAFQFSFEIVRNDLNDIELYINVFIFINFSLVHIFSKKIINKRKTYKKI